MNRQSGFTLIELMVSIAIIGILVATAIPAYNAYRERAHGGEATIMIKQLMDSQIAYFLDNDEFFPSDPSQVLTIRHDTTPGDLEYDNIELIYDNLAISLLPGRFLDYELRIIPPDGVVYFRDRFMFTISSADLSFSLPGGTPSIINILNQDGNTESMNF